MVCYGSLKNVAQKGCSENHKRRLYTLGDNSDREENSDDDDGAIVLGWCVLKDDVVCCNVAVARLSLLRPSVRCRELRMLAACRSSVVSRLASPPRRATMMVDPRSSDGDEEDDEHISHNNEEEEQEVDPRVDPALAFKLRQAKYRLDPDEKSDLVASLEHLVTVGSSVKHTTDRCEKWKKSKQDGHTIHGNDWSLDTCKMGPSARAKVKERAQERLNAAHATMPTQLRPRMLHAEDVRIFGEDGRARRAWPTVKKAWSTKDGRDEKQWDLEHGDGIHPLAFAEARLAEVPSAKRQRVDASDHLSIDTTKTGVHSTEVPRAMLLRCWQRAMDAASSVMHFERPRESNQPSTPSSTRSLSEQSNGNRLVTPAEAEAKCASLRIESSGSVCPNCEILFDSEAKQREHFFGTLIQRGCCWTLIHKRQCELIGRVLQREVSLACRDLTRMILLACMKKEQVDGQLYNWNDIYELLESEESSCNEFTDPSLRHDRRIDSVLETIQGPSESSVVLNERILEAVKMRLIERYADLPR